MDGVSNVTAATSAAGGTQGGGGLSPEQQEQFNVALAQAAGNLAAANFGILRSIMAQANKPPQ
ncbi:MAG: hypothetical protein AAGA21_02935 [Pseudomonadota bacterium]